ncbi:MAG: S1C family serine protease [Actinomycetota bacterium]
MQFDDDRSDDAAEPADRSSAPSPGGEAAAHPDIGDATAESPKAPEPTEPPAGDDDWLASVLGPEELAALADLDEDDDADDEYDLDDQFGPPPDPSVRAWRHPAEIAAAQNAAARDAAGLTPIGSGTAVAGPRRLRTLASALAATAVVGALVAGVSRPESTATINGPDGVAAFQTGGAQPLSIPATTIVPTTLVSSVVDTAATQAGAAILTASPAPTAPTRVISEPWYDVQSLEQSLIEIDDGIYAFDYLGLQRLSAFVIADNTIFTSASAVTDDRELGLVVDSHWMPIARVIRDPLSDVAVVELSPDDHDQLAASAVPSWTMPEPVAIVDADVAEPATEAPSGPTELARGTRIALVGLGSGDDATSPVLAEGIVVGFRERTMSEAGTPVYGSMLTSLDRADGTEGAPLVGDDGSLLGLVVDTAEGLLSAVPVDRLMSVGSTLKAWGVPALEWIGFEGRSEPGGGAVVTDVTDTGPAAEADLRPGDLIVRINEVQVLDWHHLEHVIREAGTGTTIIVHYERNDDQLAAPITVAVRPESEPGADGDTYTDGTVDDDVESAVADGGEGLAPYDEEQ